MRYHTILLAMIMTSASSLFANSVHGSNDDMRCAVALAYIETVLSGESGKQVVFSDEWESVSFPMTAGGWSTPERRTRISAPPRSLLAEAKRRGGQSAIKYCPSIQTRLTAAGIAYGPKVVSAIANTARGKDFRYKMEIVGVSIPVISRDKTKAVLYSSQVSGPLAGGASVYYMKRSASGKWVVVGSKLVTTA
jgi:hypothetical protein